MTRNEQELFAKADLVFTGGAGLYSAKCKQHPSVHLFPSSVDTQHFKRARFTRDEPQDQQLLPEPRIGYAGVIDERMDLALLGEIAERRPAWQLVLLGPVVKIDPVSLPRGANIHYLGMKPYADLPEYFAGWQIGMLPFALNSATKFISPTKTPEYLAAGLRVISTPIRDVVSPYGELELVGIAPNAERFIQIAEQYLAEQQPDDFRLRVERVLSASSWDRTWREMSSMIEHSLISSSVARVQAATSFKGAARV